MTPKERLKARAALEIVTARLQLEVERTLSACHGYDPHDIARQHLRALAHTCGDAAGLAILRGISPTATEEESGAVGPLLARLAHEVLVSMMTLMVVAPGETTPDSERLERLTRLLREHRGEEVAQ